jgi:hypothetical protein
MQGMAVGCQKAHADVMLASTVVEQLEAFVNGLYMGAPLERPHTSHHNPPTQSSCVLVQGAHKCLEELQGLLDRNVMSELHVNLCVDVVTTLTQLPSLPAQTARRMLRSDGCLDVYMLRDAVLEKFSPSRHVPYDFLWDSLDLLNCVEGAGGSSSSRTRVISDRHALRLIMSDFDVPGVVEGEGVETLCFVDVHASRKYGSVFIVNLMDCRVLHVGVGIPASMTVKYLAFGVRTSDAIERCIGRATGEQKHFVYEFVHFGGAFELYPCLVAVVEARVTEVARDSVARVDMCAYEWHMVQRLVAAGGKRCRNVERLRAIWMSG